MTATLRGPLDGGSIADHLDPRGLNKNSNYFSFFRSSSPSSSMKPNLHHLNRRRSCKLCLVPLFLIVSVFYILKTLFNSDGSSSQRNRRLFYFILSFFSKLFDQFKPNTYSLHFQNYPAYSTSSDSTFPTSFIIQANQKTHQHTVTAPFPRIALILKTGEEVMWERLPTQFLTFFSGENTMFLDKFMIVSDLNSRFGPHSVFNGIQLGRDILLNKTNALDSSSASSQNSSSLDKTWATRLAFMEQEARLKSLQSSKLQAAAKSGLTEKELNSVKESQGWKNDAKKNIPGMRAVFEKFPNEDWYFMFDDDTWIVWNNMLVALDKIAPDQHYMGIGGYFIGCGGVKEYGVGPMFAHGGSGILLSHHAASHIASDDNRARQCLQRHWSCWAGDVQLSLCLHDANINFTRPKFTDKHRYDFLPWNPFNKDFPWADNPCARPLTFHHLFPWQMQRLYEVESVLNDASSSGRAISTYADYFAGIYPDLVSNDPSEPRVLMQRGRINGLRPISIKNVSTDSEVGYKECHAQCLELPKCHMFGYEKHSGQCALYGGIRIDRPGMTKEVIKNGKMEEWMSGLVPSHYRC